MADIRISELQELINVQDSDVLVINDITAATTKKITRDRFLVGITRNVFDSANNAVAKQDLKVNNDLIVGGDIDATGDVSFGSLTDVTGGITALRFIGTGIENHDSNGALPTAAAVIDYLDYFLQDLYDSATLPVTLNALTDVSIVTPLSGEVLKYDGSNWINGVDSAGKENLTDLDDVLIASLSDGQVLKYNGAYWVNAIDSAGPTNLYELDDIFIDSALSANPLTVGQVLKWNGTKWANANDSGGSGGGGGGGGLDSALTLQLISSSVNLNTLSGVAITAPTTNQVIKYNGSQWVNAADSVGGASGALNDLTDVTISAPSVNQVLKYNGAAWVNAVDSLGSGTTPTLQQVIDTGATSTTTAVIPFLYDSQGAFPNASTYHGAIAHSHADGAMYFAHGGVWNGLQNTGLTLGGLFDVNTSLAAFNDIITYNGAGWVTVPKPTGLQSRDTFNTVTASLSNGDSVDVNITGAFKGYSLFKIETDVAAWVRVYTDSASRTADLGRLQSEDPAPGSGVVTEVITSGAETINLAPAPTGFNNSSPVTDTIPIKVVNLSGGTTAVDVTLTALQLEG
jgi:hypothetical protein